MTAQGWVQLPYYGGDRWLFRAGRFVEILVVQAPYRFGYMGCGFTCDAVGFADHDLETKDVQFAKRKALALVAARIAQMATGVLTEPAVRAAVTTATLSHEDLDEARTLAALHWSERSIARGIDALALLTKIVPVLDARGLLDALVLPVPTEPTTTERG